MEFLELNQILMTTADVNADKIQNYSIPIEGLSFLKLRDTLMESGKICVEDTEKQVYVASIKGGVSKRNTAVLAVSLTKYSLLVSIYSKEGLINQHTSEGVVNGLKRALKAYIKMP